MSEENVEVGGTGKCGNTEQKPERKKSRGKWKCPNPDCGKWVTGDECTNCQTGFQIKKDLDAMLKKRERDRADESRQWSRDFQSSQNIHRDDRGGNRRGGDRRGGGRDNGGRGEGGGGRYGGRGEGGGGRHGGRGGGGRSDDRRQNRGKWNDRRTDRRRDRNTHENEEMDNKDMTEEDKIKMKCGLIFGELADQLDARHDKMERIVKISRDITVESKRIIFHLHRIQHEGEADMILADVEQRLYDIRFNLWRMVALELKDEDHFQFLRKYTDGLQEWIEALSFYHYINSNRLISWQEVQDQLIFHPRSPELSDDDGISEDTTDKKDHKKEDSNKADKESTTKSDKESSAKSDKDTSKETEKDSEVSTNEETSAKAEADMHECTMRYYGKTSRVPDEAQIQIDQLSQNGEEMRVIVPQTDFVLGLADLTGELMRNAINSLSSGDRTACFTLLTFLQTMHGGFLTVEKGAPRSVSKKMTVLKQSMRKVEDACYAIAVRGSEIPDKFVADLFEKNDDYNEDN